MEDKVKRNYASKAINSAVLICSTLVLTSCSSLWLHRDQTVDSVAKDGIRPNATVPKEQYDEVVRKYQDLLNQSKNLKAQEIAVIKTPTVSNAQTKPVTNETTMMDPSELVNKIDIAIPDAPHADGVDALKTEMAKGPAVPTSMGVKTVNNTDDIDEQITRLREVQELVKANKFENALVILKELETSKEKQIVVRAKMMLGDLLFNQGEYDLSLQVYEEIITKYAFSGFVIKALGKLVVCSEKLKQPEKQAKYYSLLHDFFEAS
jgi:TolA-binding protein